MVVSGCEGKGRVCARRCVPVIYGQRQTGNPIQDSGPALKRIPMRVPADRALPSNAMSVPADEFNLRARGRGFWGKWRARSARARMLDGRLIRDF